MNDFYMIIPKFLLSHLSKKPLFLIDLNFHIVSIFD